MDSMNPQSDCAPPRPLVGAALLFAAGLAAARILPGAPVEVGLAGAGALGAAGALADRVRRTAGVSSVLLGAAVAAIGMTLGLVTAPGRCPLDLRNRIARDRATIEAVVTLTGAPFEWLPRLRADRAVWEAPCRVEAVRHESPRWTTASGTARVRLVLEDAVPPPSYGDRWRVTAVGTADAGRGSIRLDTLRDRSVRMASGGGHPVVRWCLERREASRKILERGIEDWPEAASMIAALVLGYRETVPGDVVETFVRTGVAHVFAISGLHVGIFGLGILTALRAAGLSRRTWPLILIPLLGLYTLATGAAVSAVRALAMAAAYWSAPLVRRRPDAPSALALAAIVILAVDPDQLADPGFLFSFVTVAGILALAPAVLERMSGWIPSRDGDASAPAPVRPLRRAARATAALAATSVAAWIASTPLTMIFGNQVAPAALIGNLFVVPAAFLIVSTGCLSLVFGTICPLAAEVFNHANAFFCAAMNLGIEGLFDVPGSHMFVRSPPGWAVGMGYAAVAGLMILRGRPRAVLLGAAVAVVAAGAVRHATDDAVRVMFPPRDLVPAVFIDAPGHDDWLIDPGPAWKANRMVRWLRSRGVDRLGALVVTTADAAHLGAANEVLDRIPTKEIFRTADPGRSRVARAAVEAWTNEERRVTALVAGDRGEASGGLEWEVFHPQPGVAHARAADSSLVIRLGRRASAVLLAGAAGPAIRASLADGPADPASPVVVMNRPPDAEDAAWMNAAFVRRVLVRPGTGGFVPEPAAGADAPTDIETVRLEEEAVLFLR